MANITYLLEEFIINNPVLGILVVSFVISLLVTLVYKYTINQEQMKELKKRQKETQEKIKSHKDKPEKMMELNKELMAQTGEMMKHQFKPMLFTLLPLLFMFKWMRALFISTPFEKSWIIYYIVFSLISNILFKKIFKVAF
jgi:uncharacterized membrane protein (DUF106 family)